MNYAEAITVMEAVSLKNGFKGFINPEFLGYLRDTGPYVGWDFLARDTGYNPQTAVQAFEVTMDGFRKLLAPKIN